MLFTSMCFIARQDISAQQSKSDRYDSSCAEEMAAKLPKRIWGLKSLPYRVKKNRKGHYSLLNIDASHEAVSELERRISVNDDIIRHITIRVDEHEADESIQMRNKNRDDRRGPRRDDDDRRGPRRERDETPREGDAS
jgi:ribosomal protein S6